jgi:type II secretory pathway pseudopilin PulG
MTKHQRGFTIVEAMLGIAVFTIVALAMAGTFLVGYRAISNEATDISAGTATSDASIWLIRDLTSADSRPAGTVNSSNSLTFTYGQGVTTVTYAVDANRNLTRAVGGSTQVAARGITSVTIGGWGAGCYGTVTIQPSASGAPAVVLNVSNRPGGCF